MAAQKTKDDKANQTNNAGAEAKASSSVHKIAPYPILVELTKVEGQPPLKGSIVKMTEVGFLMKVDTIHFYKVGENLHLQFKLPVVNATVRCDGKVIKTYDAMEAVGELKGKLYTVEIHFKNIIEKEKAAVVSYLVKSGQKKF